MSRLRVNKLTNKDNNGAPEFVHGVTVSGVATATKFKGDGSELTSVTTNFNILDSGVPSGTISSLNFGNGISIDSTLNSVATISVDTSNLASLSGATFTGEINIGGYDSSSNTADGVLLGSVGGVYSQLADGNPSGVLFQGMHGSTFTSRITAAGSAMFANDITLDRATAPSDVKISGSDTHAVWLSDGNFVLKYDGSATFKGETIVQGTGKYILKRNDAGATSCAIRDDNLRIFNNPVSYDDYKISLENDGSASFDGTITAAGYSFSNLTEL